MLGSRMTKLNRQDVLLIALILSVSLNIALIGRTARPAFTDLANSFKRPQPVSVSDHFRGDPNSEITVLVYSDFQCPYCKDLHENLKSLQGHVQFRWIYRHFLVEGHSHAQLYAEGSECAAVQGKFWEFADALFSAPTDPPPYDRLSSLVVKLGIDGDRFGHCLETKETQLLLSNNLRATEILNITGTPTFFVNGKRFQGTRSAEELRALIAPE